MESDAIRWVAGCPREVRERFEASIWPWTKTIKRLHERADTQNRELHTVIVHSFPRYDFVPEKGARGVAKVMGHFITKEIEIGYFMGL